MRIATGRVVDGKIVVDGPSLDEGAAVAIVSLDGDEAFELSRAQEDELRRALAAADRGEGMDGDEFLADLQRGH